MPRTIVIHPGCRTGSTSFLDRASHRLDSEYSIWWIRADGAGQPEKLFGEKTPLQPFSISPDGRHVAFVRTGRSTDFEIWTMLLDLNDPDHPKPGQSGADTARTRGRSRPGLLTRRALAGVRDYRWSMARSAMSLCGRFRSLLRHPGGRSQMVMASFPIWSRNGKELFYLSDDNHIMVTRYTAGLNSFVAEKPRQWSPVPLFRPANNSLWNLDLAPDGKRFVVLAAPEGREDEATLHVTVLLSFFDELRRRLPVGNK